MNNNPVRYSDPTGHKPCWATNNYSCNNLTQEIAIKEYAKYSAKDKSAVAAFFQNYNLTDSIGPIDSKTIQIGEPIDPGELLWSYSDSTVSRYYFVWGFSGRIPVAVALKYSVTVNVSQYENLTKVFVQEDYAMLDAATPNLQNGTWGQSSLIYVNFHGERHVIGLGDFVPIEVSDRTDIPISRYTTINYWGAGNEPHELVLRVTFGASGVGYKELAFRLTSIQGPILPP